MRVLYLASKPDSDADLKLTREITELQERFWSTSSEPPIFQILPDLRVEDVPGQLGRFLPDVLHVSAHSNEEVLSLSNTDGIQIPITAEILAAFLPSDRPPSVLYLNSCNSKALAKSLVECGAVPTAIGTTAAITNQEALASAVNFYQILVSGFSVGEAFKKADSVLRALSGGRASMEMYSARRDGLRTKIINPVPRIVAEITRKTASKNHFGFKIGVSGTPATTTQVTFFTDDESFIKSDDSLENDLSLIVRTTPVDGLIWSDDDDWSALGDHRLLAVGIKAGCGCFAVESTLCQAIELWYRTHQSTIPHNIRYILKQLKKNDGGGLPIKSKPRRSRKRK